MVYLNGKDFLWDSNGTGTFEPSILEKQYALLFNALNNGREISVQSHRTGEWLKFRYVQYEYFPVDEDSRLYRLRYLYESTVEPPVVLMFPNPSQEFKAR